MTVKEVLVEAMRMLGLDAEADETEALPAGGETQTTKRFLRFYNLTVRQIAEEYRRNDYPEPPIADNADAEAAEFYGVSERVLAYGVAAEYCVTEGLDEAVTWDARYKDGIAAAARPKTKIAARRMF